MRTRAPCITLLLLLPAAVVRGAGPERGFQPERRVREATRLDWEFAAGADARRLPSGYDSRQQRYQLFVPATYKATRAWPLVLFVSPGDDPLGWRAWRQPCEDAGWLFAAAYGAGNACPPAQRVRAVLDVLDDVRRHYRIDPDRTYLAGSGGGSAVACRIAFALPELFGGVVCQEGDAPLPAGGHLLRRAGERLSVAFVADERGRGRQEKYLGPLYRELGVRSRLWVAPPARPGHGPPDAEVLAPVQRWLEDDLKRRQADRRDRIGAEAPSHRAQAALALNRARQQLRRPGGLAAGADELEWLVRRWGKTESAERAAGLLAELRRDPDRGKALAAQVDVGRRAVLAAQARGLERLGRLEGARLAWEQAAGLGDAAARAAAAAEAQRLAGLLARRPYLGATFAGETTEVMALAPGGPADRAGLRPGDRLERVGPTKVATPAEVRACLHAARPGDSLRLGLRRGGKAVSLLVKLGAPPRE